MTLLSAVVPFLIGWILIGTAKYVIQLCVARVVLGFALAFAFTVVPMYCGEIAEVNVVSIHSESKSLVIKRLINIQTL